MFGEVKDLDAVLINFLDDKELLALSSVNKYFNNLCSGDDFWKSKVMRKKKVHEPPKGKSKIIYFGVSHLYDFADKIAKAQDIVILDWLKDMLVFPKTLHCSKLPIPKVLDWLHQNERSFTVNNLNIAIQNNQWDVVGWLISKGIKPQNPEEFNILTKSGKVELLELLSTGNLLPTTYRYAIENNHLKVVEWMYEKGISITQDNASSALSNDKVDILRFFLSKNIKPNNFYDVKSVEMIQMLEKNKIFFTEKDVERAISYGNIIILSYLKEQGMKYEEKHIDLALVGGTESIEFFMGCGLSPSQDKVNEIFMRKGLREDNSTIKLLLKKNIYPDLSIMLSIMVKKYIARKIYEMKAKEKKACCKAREKYSKRNKRHYSHIFCEEHHKLCDECQKYVYYENCNQERCGECEYESYDTQKYYSE